MIEMQRERGSGGNCVREKTAKLICVEKIRKENFNLLFQIIVIELEVIFLPMFFI